MAKEADTSGAQEGGAAIEVSGRSASRSPEEIDPCEKFFVAYEECVKRHTLGLTADSECAAYVSLSAHIDMILLRLTSLLLPGYLPSLTATC
mmetsp:Transcript_2497/g.6764  ORF Transcript_2497/g.6764 Transcript_2497/m.6764 type:complete len:92 (-) Transcript_2497:193-468(-)